MMKVERIAYVSADAEDIPVIFGFCKDLIERYEDMSSVSYDKVLNWSYDKITKNIDRYQCVVVDGIKVGYFHLDITGDRAELDDLYVLPEYRGIGIATSVIRYCIQQAKQPIFLYVFAKNAGAIRLYTKLGFVIAEKVGNTRLIMRRDC